MHLLHKLCLLLAALATLCLRLPLLDDHRSWLFDRQNYEFECPASDTNPIRVGEQEKDAFARDGVLVLRDVISPEWLRSYRMLLVHVFENESRWDVLYSRLVANFYSAQKSIFLHQSSRCGLAVGSRSPVPTIVAQLLAHAHALRFDDVRLRVMEPTAALISFFDRGGHTTWHRDDPYMHYRQTEGGSNGNSTVVVRVWVPLMDLSPDQMIFLALNNSRAAREERDSHGLDIQGTDFRSHDRYAQSEIIERQVVARDAGGYRAGDAVVFAGDTPHFAQSVNCSSVGCARLLFSFALDGAALYDDGKATALLPLDAGQERGAPLGGSQFPLIFPEPDRADWARPLRPTYGNIASSLLSSFRSGAGSFYGFDPKKSLAYFSRVKDCFVEDLWIRPRLDLDTGKRNDVVREN